MKRFSHLLALHDALCKELPLYANDLPKEVHYNPCVCERERVCVCVRERESVCVCVRERESERERERKKFRERDRGKERGAAPLRERSPERGVCV